MEKIVWRYQPEFRISIKINGTDAADAVKVVPAPSFPTPFKNYGVLTRNVPGGAVAYVRQFKQGAGWVPEVNLTAANTFTFWLYLQRKVDFFNNGSQRFGRQILYANNLSAAGAIDSNLAANVVQLTTAAAAGDTERGALSTFLLSSAVNPGDFTAFKAGKIAAGAPVSFSVNTPVAPTQTSVGLDVSAMPKGAYIVRLEGGAPVQERVIFDQVASGSAVNGIIEIYKDAWQLGPQPREYSINFLST